MRFALVAAAFAVCALSDGTQSEPVSLGGPEVGLEESPEEFFQEEEVPFEDMEETEAELTLEPVMVGESVWVPSFTWAPIVDEEGEKVTPERFDEEVRNAFEGFGETETEGDEVPVEEDGELEGEDREGVEETENVVPLEAVEAAAANALFLEDSVLLPVVEWSSTDEETGETKVIGEEEMTQIVMDAAEEEEAAEEGEGEVQEAMGEREATEIDSPSAPERNLYAYDSRVGMSEESGGIVYRSRRRRRRGGGPFAFSFAFGGPRFGFGFSFGRGFGAGWGFSFSRRGPPVEPATQVYIVRDEEAVAPAATVVSGTRVVPTTTTVVSGRRTYTPPRQTVVTSPVASTGTPRVVTYTPTSSSRVSVRTGTTPRTSTATATTGTTTYVPAAQSSSVPSSARVVRGVPATARTPSSTTSVPARARTYRVGSTPGPTFTASGVTG
mmetsp:Transcript_36212/g.71235  ORF Transcript_36212/g.71235 Transcript_36212/m.71235 type:complete len:441 (+) Transcript_36212:77-1399(+)